MYFGPKYTPKSINEFEYDHRGRLRSQVQLALVIIIDSMLNTVTQIYGAIGIIPSSARDRRQLLV